MRPTWCSSETPTTAWTETDGWTGAIQYLHIEQTDQAGDNMIEADNREGDEQATPISEPTLANLTMVGNPGERAIRLRRGTGLHLYNSMVSGAANCLRIQGESLNLLNTRITFQGVGLDCDAVSEGDDVAAVQGFLDGSVNVTQDGTVPNRWRFRRILIRLATRSSDRTSRTGVRPGPSA